MYKLLFVHTLSMVYGNDRLGLSLHKFARSSVLAADAIFSFKRALKTSVPFQTKIYDFSCLFSNLI